MSELPPPPSPVPERQPTALAGPAKRLAAGAIDGFLLIVLITFATGAALGNVSDPDNLTSDQEQSIVIAVIVALSVWLNYLVFCEWRWGRTAGKAALDISVVSSRSAPVSWNRALVRNLARVPDLIGFFLLVPDNPLEQRLGDRAAKTIVVRGARDDYVPSLGDPPRVERPATENRWSAWQTTDMLIGLLMVIGGVVLTGPIVFALTSGDPAESLVAITVQDAVFLAVPLVIATWRAPGGAWSLVGFNRFRARDLVLVVGALGAQIVFAALITTLLVTPEQDSIIEDAGFDETTLTAIAAVIAVVILAPVTEEALFRGLLFGALRSSLAFWKAALISGVLFGAVHLTTGDFAVAGLLAFFGILLAWLYERTGSLGPPIALHAINNAIAIVPLLT